MKKAHWIVLVLVGSAITAYVAVNLFTTERQRVERAVRGMVRRIERRDPAGFCLYLAEDYKDNNGQNRAAVRSLLSQGLPMLGSVSVTISEVQIEVRQGEPKTARVEFDGRVEATGRTREEMPPWLWRSPVRLQLRKQDGEWRVTEAEYRMPPLHF